MAEQKKDRTRRQPSEKVAGLIPEKYRHLVSIAVIFILLPLFLNEVVFNGKVFVSGDTVAARSFETLIDDAKTEGIFPLWNPYIFCGMPGYASLSIHGDRNFDVTATVSGWLSNIFGHLMIYPDVGYIIYYYFLFGVGIYFFTFYKLRNRVVALFVSFATLYSTYIIIWIMVGHVTKIAVLAYFPYVFWLVETLREKFSLLSFLLLIVVLHLMFLPGHIQMIFYIFFAFGCFYLFFLIRGFVKKENWQGVLRSGVLLAVGSALAFGLTADQYLSTLEYAPFSMRGADPIVSAKGGSQTGKSEAKLTKGGLDYEYATNWSFSPGETFTFLIPSLYGFGQHQYRGVLTNNQPTRLNTYFGQQTFTDAAQYMGVVVVVLACIGAVRKRREPFVQYLAALTVLGLLISFGREFPPVYDLMFYHFPMFNKFRIPSMILILVQVSVPLLAGYGVVSLMEERGRSLSASFVKRWKYAVVGLGGLAVLAVVAKSFFGGIYSAFFPEQEVTKALSRSYGNQPEVLGELYRFIADSVTTDIAVGLVLLTITFGAFYYYWQKKISLNILAMLLLGSAIFDLWRVDYKPMETHDRQQADKYFAKPDYVQFLQRDTTLYRVLQFINGQPPYSNELAYWRIQSAYGYQGAKMRAFQDMVDNINLGNPLLWGLMDVRYILSNRVDTSGVLALVFKGREMNVHYNRAELPRAFFVNRYEVKSGIEILNSISAMSFHPFDVAYFMDDPHVEIDSVRSGASVEYTRYGIQDLQASVTATGDNLIFFSEAYYPEGWKAYVDDNETKIYRLNYFFRGVIVPAGKHTVTMKFEPRGFYIGKMYSLGMNAALLVLLGVFGSLKWVKRKKGDVAAGV